jgi:hypothetical protein
MRYSLLTAAVVAALSLGAASASAQLVYGFETGDPGGGRDGFLPNNGISSTLQSTVGVTQGLNSLQVITPGGFVGSYTTADLPAVLSSPGFSGVTADVTISPNDPAFTGTFSDLTMGYFVSNGGEGQFGDLYASPTSDWPNIDLAPGTYTGVSLPLVGSFTDPVTSVTYNSLGALVAAGTGWSVSGAEILVDGNGVQTFYLDNIQAVVPEPASLSVIGLTGAALLARRRRKI